MGDEERCAAHGALDDCVELDDRVCPGCGFHECGCAARKPERVAEPEPAGVKGSDAGLAPGWTEDLGWYPDGRANGCALFQHANGAHVWRPGSAYSWSWSRGTTAEGWVTDRDEAMARALGWYPEGSSWFVDLGNACRAQAAQGFGSSNGKWSVCAAAPNGAYPNATNLPSLPYAIAFVREALGMDAKPEPEGASELGAVPKGWKEIYAGEYWSTNDNSSYPFVERSGRRYNGVRNTPRVAPTEFSSREAAMLYALGCTVTELGGERLCVTAGSTTYSVDTTSQAVRLVEMLTAERAAT